MDTDELWYGTGVPSLAGKCTHMTRAAGIFKKIGGDSCLCGGHNLPPLIEIGLANWPINMVRTHVRIPSGGHE